MHEPIAICTLLLIVGTIAASWFAFRSYAVEEQYIFNPEAILAEKQFHRLITSGFLHADWNHLIFNMLTLYLFGRAVEGRVGSGNFLLVYLGAIVGGNLLSLYVHRNHEYRAYGASGGVCGIIFSYILLFPGAGVSFYLVPISIPGWLYAIGYMLYSFFGMKAGNRGNIGHDAHLGGAIIGLLITAGLQPDAVRYNTRIFLIVLSSAVLLLVYLWINPMFLPMRAFAGFRRGGRAKERGELPAHKRESLRVDAILEKISKKGIDSLTAEEKSTLENVSGKIQRRAESRKPESGLAI